MADDLSIKWTADRLADGRWRGNLIVPMVGPLRSGAQLLTASSLSPDGYDAQHKAATLMKQALQNPILQALAPPGAPLALEMAQGLLHGIQSGKAREVLHQVPDQMKHAAHSLVEGLKSIFGYLPEELYEQGYVSGTPYPWGHGG
jgi:hypothetical protein